MDFFDEDECLARMAFFLNTDNEVDDREATFNDPRIPDAFIHRWVLSLPEEKRVIAIGRSTRASLLDFWAGLGTSVERKMIAFNPATPPATLRAMADDVDLDVVAQIAFNPSADASTLALLFKHPDEGVASAVHDAFETEMGWIFRQGCREAIHTGDDADDHGELDRQDRLF